MSNLPVPTDMSNSNPLHLMVSRSVIDPRPVRMDWAADRTVLELVAELVAAKHLARAVLNAETDWQLYIVIAHPDPRIAPMTVPRERWAMIKPKPGMILSLAIRPGKGGGGKNPMRTLLMIAVIAASYGVASWASAYAVSNMGVAAGSFAAKAIGGLASGLVTAIGNTIINSIAPAPRPTLSNLQGRFASDGRSLSSQQRQVSGTRNTADPFGPIPQPLGGGRIAPRLAAEPYIEASGADTYLRQPMVFGVGPTRIKNLKIGPTPLEQYEDYDLELREGWDDDAELTLYPETPKSDQHNRTLAHNDPVVVETRTCKEAVLDFSFPSGLVYFTDDGTPASTAVRLRIERRLKGTSDWAVVETTTHAPQTDTYFDAAWYLTRHPDVAGDAYFGSRPWEHYTNHGRSEGRAVKWKSADVWELRGDSEYPQLRSCRLTMPDHTCYEVQITRLNAESTSLRTRDECRIATVKNISPSNPIGLGGLATGAIRYKTGKDFHDIVDQLTAEVEPLVYYPDENDVWDWRYTENQAWLAFHVLTGRANRKAIALADVPNRIDLAAFRAFAAFCDEVPANGTGPRFRYKHLVDYRTSVLQKAQDICATARGQLVKIAGKYSVVFDGPKGSEDAIVAPENSWNFARRITYVQLPHGLRVRYEDPDDGIKEVIVYRKGYTADTATLFEALELEGCPTAEQAYREGTYWFEVTQLRRATTFLSLSLYHLTFTVGSVVRVAHPIPRWGLATGDIASVTKNGGGQIIAITLKTPVIMEAAKAYCVRIRLKDNSSVYELVDTVAGEQTTLTLQTPIDRINPIDPDTEPGAGDLVTFGERDFETRRLICKKVRRLNDDFDARCEFADEAPEVHTIEQEAIPAHITSTVSNRLTGAPEPVVHLQVVERITFVAGMPISSVLATWSPADGTLPAAYEVYRLTDDGIWVYQMPVTQGRYELQGVTVGETVTLAVLAVGRLGGKLSIDDAPTASVTIAGDVQGPGDLRRLTVEETASGVRRFQAEYDRAPDHAGFRFKYHVGSARHWASGLPLHDELVTALPFETDRLTTGTYTVLAKAVDTSGNESDNAAVVVMNLGERLVENVIQSVDLGALGFAGTVTGGAVAGGEVVADDPGTPFWSIWATPFWAGDTEPFWTANQNPFWIGDTKAFWANEAAPFWQAIYNAVTYQDGFVAEGPGILSIDVAGRGALSVEYRSRYGRPFWIDPDADFWTDPTATFWHEDDWRAYSGPVRTTEGDHDIRITAPSGVTRGRITTLSATIDLEDDVQKVEDVVISAAGTRVPLARAMRSIKAVNISIQDDGGDAVTWRVIDKDPALGPLIELRTAGLAATSGLIDATIQGVRK
ncbi:phage tail protein [Magnetovibrio sp.]|uniref:phage tail protein n=1 Tax=Magnetovibrio sp. TaxID=2024836 RepID=UPI002F9408E5